MPLVSKLYQSKSKWIKASDLEDGDAIFTIADVREELIGQPGNQDRKLVLHFREDPTRFLALNKINATTLASMFGDNSDDWRGHSITLYASETSYAGEQVACVRIRTTPRRPIPRTGGRSGVMPLSGPKGIPSIPPVEPAEGDDDQNPMPF